MAMDIQTRIEALEKKLKQAKALALKQKAAERSRLAKSERAADTRKKVLIGAFVLDKLTKAGSDPALVTFGDGQLFIDWLTRPEERALFGFKTEEQK